VQNSQLLENFVIYCENGPTSCGLNEQIYNRINILSGFDLGTLCNKKKIQKMYILVIDQSAKGIRLNYSMLFEIMTAVSNHPDL